MTVSPASHAAFSITVQPSGRVFTATHDEAILAAGIRQGIGLPYGCKDGACGSCKCKKLSGEVVHGPHQAKALSAEEAAQGLILTCCAIPQSDVVLESRQVTEQGALPIKKMPTRVTTMARLSNDVVVLNLQLPANDSFLYRAGQYVEFILRDGARRSYSMANAPGQANALELHIRHMPGGKFTDHVREDSDAPLVFLASGTGFAPIKALLEHMHSQDIQRPVTVYWGGRRPADLYMDTWLRDQQARMPQLRYVPVVSDAQAEDGWTGRTGFVHRAVLEDLPDLSGHQVYACGAPIVVDSARQDFCALAGLPEEAFFADAFTSEADKHAA
jgi:CDP-4-dehydro-6-deoxyglucose reductase